MLGTVRRHLLAARGIGRCVSAETTRLATDIAAAVTRITGIAAERVLVVIERSPARFAVEGGRVLPEPGHEQAWIAGSR
jgi:hypothetical protein